MRCMTQYEIESLWVENRRQVVFRFADIVRIKAGDHAGKEGKIVALVIDLPTFAPKQRV